MPTLLNLVNAPIQDIQKYLTKTHSEVHPFVGRNLAPILYGLTIPDEPICFMTNDNVLKGENQITVTGKPYLTVGQPSNIQTVITKIINKNLVSEIWKYSRYFDDPNFWSKPDVKDIVIVSDTLYKIHNGPQKEKIVSVTKTDRIPDQIELYNITKDPQELHNLAHIKKSTHETKKIQNMMSQILINQIKQKFLTPHRIIMTHNRGSWYDQYHHLIKPMLIEKN